MSWFKKRNQDAAGKPAAEGAGRDLAGDGDSRLARKSVDLDPSRRDGSKAPAVAPGRRPGRPSNAEKAQELAAKAGLVVVPAEQAERIEGRREFSAPQCEKFVRMPFAVLAGLMGPHWKLSPEETKELAEDGQEVINQYLPDILARHGALVLFGFTFALTVAAKARVQFELWDAAKAAKAAAENAVPEPSETVH